jgi:hypothetical protein
MPTDPTAPIRKQAAALPAVVSATSCNQTSFKVGKAAFLFIGPGARGQGFKAMFKLERSMPAARKLATAHPERFEVGSTGWVTARFTAQEPLPASTWQSWLKESFELSSGAGAGAAKRKPAAPKR